jgi:hypothetical protein
MPASLATTQNVADAHDTPRRPYGHVPLLQPGTIWVVVQAPAPPAGSVELITSP